MARTGLYKSEVKNARDALLLQGRHPSVDAVRIELGNTGSKTTIHKYLKELEEDDESRPPKVPVSEALQDLVTRLAAQLQTEADAEVSLVKSEADEELERLSAEIDELHQTNTLLAARLEQLQTDASAEKTAHRQTINQLQAQLQDQSAARHTLELHSAVLTERLEGNEQHRRSVEQKHQDALEALEHHRATASAQRDHDARRHEQQMQALQDEIHQLRQNVIVDREESLRINQEAVRLASELMHARQALDMQQTAAMQLRQQLETIGPVVQQKDHLEAQISDKNALIAQLHSQVAALVEANDAVKEQFHRCQIDLAATAAKLDVQQLLSRELRGYLSRARKNTGR